MYIFRDTGLLIFNFDKVLQIFESITKYQKNLVLEIYVFNCITLQKGQRKAGEGLKIQKKNVQIIYLNLDDVRGFRDLKTISDILFTFSGIPCFFEVFRQVPPFRLISSNWLLQSDFILDTGFPHSGLGCSLPLPHLRFEQQHCSLNGLFQFLHSTPSYSLYPYISPSKQDSSSAS